MSLSYNEDQLKIYERVFNNTSEGIMITDTNSRILAINPAFTFMTGYSFEEVHGQRPSILHSGKHDKLFYTHMWESIVTVGYWRGEIWNRRKNGQVYPERLTINTVRDETGTVTNYVGIFSDISEMKQSEENLRFLANHDVLTGLPNRFYFQKKLSRIISDAETNESMVSLMFIDLDKFKYINDTLGHNVGDKILNEVGARLACSVRKGDVVSRLGGDEFTVILPNISNGLDALKVAQKISDEMKRPFEIEGKELFLTSSIGISLYPVDGKDSQTLINNADTAMYRAKDMGNHIQTFTSNMNAYITRRVDIENCMHRAIINGEFELYYQPQINSSTGEINGAEALLRWPHAKLGMVSPAEFIPIAEENGLIIPIGEWVIRAVCEQIKKWEKQFVKTVKVSINLSPRQLQQNEIVKTLQNIIRETDVDPSLLSIEITESMSLSHSESILKTLNNIKKLGVTLALDDFGTGHSSFAYLSNYPLDVLKIDKSLINQIEINSGRKAIVRAIIAMADGLNLSVVAEGVETKEELAILDQLGCSLIQGYYYSKPLSAYQFEINYLQG